VTLPNLSSLTFRKCCWNVGSFLSDFYGTQRFITAFTAACHLSLSWARSIQSTPSSNFSKIHFNISVHLRLGLPSVLLHSGFPHQNLVRISPCLHTCTWPAHSSLLDVISRMFGTYSSNLCYLTCFDYIYKWRAVWSHNIFHPMACRAHTWN
jgi:hypothetical protein